MTTTENQQEDKLNRKEEAKFLINYLTKRYEIKGKEPFVLNVNAKWGYGKTFFLNLVQKELEQRGHEVIYFDAWKNDFTKEPLLAFFSEINCTLEKYLEAYNEKENPIKEKLKKSALPIIGSVITKQLTGMSIDKINSILDEEEKIEDDTSTNIENSLSSIISKTTELALKEHQTLKDSIEEFKENMKTILELIKTHGKQLPLFILIDELDRCRPNYAIELLENIKHIFDIESIYFIIATNSKQLSHSIKAIYGTSFSSEKYLKRFFDQEYNLKELNKYKYIEFLFNKTGIDQHLYFNPLREEIYPNENINIILTERLSNYFELTLRDINQCINTLFTISITWNKNQQIDLTLILYFIMLKQKDNLDFEKEKNTHEGLNVAKFNSKTKIKLTNYSMDQYGFPQNTKEKDTEIFKLFSSYYRIINTDNIYDIEINGYEEVDNILKNYKNIRWNENNKLLREYPLLVESAAQLK